MKKILLLLLIITIKSYSQQPSIEWGGSIGSIYFDYANDASITLNGDILVTGGYALDIDLDFGAGTHILNGMSYSDAYISKYDGSGNILWGVSFANNNNCFGVGIDTDSSGNVYSVGEFFNTIDFDPGPNTFNLTGTAIGPYPNRNIYISKLDVNGNFVWAKKIGGDNSMGIRALKVDTNGNSYITGYFNKPITFPDNTTLTPLNQNDANNFDIFIAKLDTAGNLLWAKQIGSGSIVQRAESIALDNSGNIYLGGQFHNTVDFDPGDSQHMVNPQSTNSTDLFILKLDSNGNFIWVKSLGGDNSSNRAYDLAIDNTENLYLTGSFSNTIDFDPSAGSHIISDPGTHPFLLKLNNSGNFEWVKNFSGNGEGRSIKVNLDNSVCVTGGFRMTCDFSGGNGTAIHTSNGGLDIFMSEYSSNGSLNWVKCIGGTDDDTGVSITNNSSGDIYSFGNFMGSASINTSLDDLSLTSQGNQDQDIFILKISETLRTENFLKNKLSVYPNPASKEIHIKFPKTFSNGNINIYSTKGQIVKNCKIKKTINIENLAKGQYIIKAFIRNQEISTKLIIE